jgi:THO complex subunit 7
MATIHLEHEAQDKIMFAQNAALHSVVADLSSLRLIGKDEADMDTSRPGTPPDDSATPSQKADTTETGTKEEKEDGEDSSDEAPFSTTTAASLNPHAKPFSPASANAATRLLRLRSTASGASSSAAPSPSPIPFKKLIDEEDDIEMGEVAEDGEERGVKRAKKVKNEELEEGEATDMSSELSELPDD